MRGLAGVADRPARAAVRRSGVPAGQGAPAPGTPPDAAKAARRRPLPAVPPRRRHGRPSSPTDTARPQIHAA